MRNITFLFYLFKIMLNLWLWWNLILAVVEYYRQNNKTETLIRSLFAIICLLIMILIGISNIAVG